ncbi:unnamed protein product [Adineta steineri]|uniref:Histone acetyltransferase n=1 Tax=Adineta steineri TaxID=433720 RepID=A0A814ZW71_9BILA|nr:unnamed protein product [Adineta steineri]
MSQQKKTTHRKSSKSSASSSENNLREQIEEPLYRATSSTTSSTKKTIYPNVPKRTSRMALINEPETMQTESQIFVIPSIIKSQKSNGFTPMPSSVHQTLHNLNLITKYTSPQKASHESNDDSLSSISSQISFRNDNSLYNQLKHKRSLSLVNRKDLHANESKRIKPYDEEDDEDDDEDDLSELLDFRYHKQILSQSTTDNEQSKPKPRKPTARKLSSSQQRPTTLSTQSTGNSSCKSPETLIIEPDIDEDDITMDRQESISMHTNSQISNKQHNSHSKLEHILSQGKSNVAKSSKSVINKTPISTRSPLYNTTKQVQGSSSDNISPNSNGERTRISSESSQSFYDTPCSSLSRTTTTTRDLNATPQIIIKIDNETQTSALSDTDMLNQLIKQMNINVNNNISTTIYNPIDLAKKLFQQFNSFSSRNKYHTMNSFIKRQLLNFGRYEIEVLFPINHDIIPTIYACDICLKHFHGSSIAFQRHKSKCLCTQPPGKLVFSSDDLAIFQIGEVKMNIQQRIYIKSLCRITRLFIDSNKSVDDRKIDRFIYYILCRKDPILSQFQPPLYRFIGYFSKKLNHDTQQSINNFSCLSILPPFAQYHEYNQLLIAFSYYLIRSNTSTNLACCSPARPLDNATLFIFHIYCLDVIFDYINNANQTSITLDTLARQTSIHPRDILSSLYSKNLILPCSIDKTSIYLIKNAYHSMTSLNIQLKNKLLFMDTKLIVTNNEKQIIHDKHNFDKNQNSAIQEIILD